MAKSGVGRGGVFSRISTRVSLFVAGVVFLVWLVVLALLHVELKREAEAEARHSAQLLMDRQQATLHYFAWQRPFRGAQAKRLSKKARKRILPPQLSPLEASEKINNHFSRNARIHDFLQGDQVVFLPGSEKATSLEELFMARLRENPELETVSEQTAIDGEEMLLFMGRSALGESQCGGCHAGQDGERLEAALQVAEGDTMGDELFLSIRIPLKRLYDRATWNAWRLSGLFFCALMGVVLVGYLLLSHFLFQPLAQLSGEVVRLSDRTDQPGEQIPVPPEAELADIAVAVNRLSLFRVPSREEK
ncbi:MAG: DUF3365 domain-containing protein [Magnetococcales bacterium]|nr:DUF3365 domain-containing protein [Magnetococcales bacterium]